MKNAVAGHKYLMQHDSHINAEAFAVVVFAKEACGGDDGVLLIA